MNVIIIPSITVEGNIDPIKYSGIDKALILDSYRSRFELKTVSVHGKWVNSDITIKSHYNFVVVVKISK